VLIITAGASPHVLWYATNEYPTCATAGRADTCVVSLRDNVIVWGLARALAVPARFPIVNVQSAAPASIATLVPAQRAPAWLIYRFYRMGIGSAFGTHRYGLSLLVRHFGKYKTARAITVVLFPARAGLL
jgi:hypothetical protein